MSVLNTLGHGFLEKLYENAMVIEFQEKNIPYQQQISFDVSYKGVSIGTYIPDLIVNDRIVVDVKTIDRISNNEKGQMLNYLKVTNVKVGLIINFKHAKLEWERIVL